ncbi:MAG: hypothetical protein P1U53_02480 [Sulfitobacter sp.]|nr:hypothetical protein [Sulfitobacter sp.]
MMNSNKILTVSYGTFSCTLEGFEDSFGTMKAIAEYFRDLAADDRYFGAEPPQPDAEMLARIAQKEISRKVSARQQEGTIVLSALEDRRAPDEAAAPEEEAGAPTDARTDPAKTRDADPTAEEMSEAPAPTPVEETPVEVRIEGLNTTSEPELETPQSLSLENLSLGEPTVSRAPEATEAADEATELAAQTAEESTFAAPAAPETPDARMADIAQSTPGDETSEETEDEVESFFASPLAAVPSDVPPVPEAESEAEDEPPAPPVRGQSIAEKLQRIRAVVAKTQGSDRTEAEEDYLEDEHAAGRTSRPAVMRETLEDIESALEVDDAVELSQRRSDPVQQEEEADADDLDALLSRLEKDNSDSLFAESDDALEEEAEDTDAELNSLFSEDLDEDTIKARDDEVLSAAIARATGVSPREETPVRSETALAQKGVVRPRARVIKVKRAALDAAIARGDVEEYDDEEEVQSTSIDARALDDIAPSKTERTSLQPDEEAELARELAELEADIEAENSQADAKAAPQDRDDHAPKERADTPQERQRQLESRGESDVNRLLAEADQQMDEPESATRRNAFSHLRAAVAAQNADVAMGGRGRSEPNDDAYRSDLAEVVRPRRPESGPARSTPRPGENRPAPLKLVAEQRIDTGRPRQDGPVRPRRVAAAPKVAKGVSAHDGDSFADYAHDLGAKSLSQLLEAAASYMVFVEGHEEFSRPDLMSKVRQASGNDDFSREEGLRSFGQLLRAGKIEKIKGGRFAVSDDIGFRPDQRAAG